jgi:hypothetical protein
VSSRIGFATPTTRTKAALYVDWRRARPDVLVLREAGPSHDVPPFESVELVNAAARLGELMKATIALLLLIFRFTVLDRAFWQHLIVAIAFFLSLVSADSARTAALVMRPWVRLYRRREGREPPSRRLASRGRGATRCRRRAPRSCLPRSSRRGSTWRSSADPIELGVGTYVTGARCSLSCSRLLVLFFAPYTDESSHAGVGCVCSTGSSGSRRTCPSVLTIGGKPVVFVVVGSTLRSSTSTDDDSDDASRLALGRVDTSSDELAPTSTTSMIADEPTSGAARRQRRVAR